MNENLFLNIGNPLWKIKWFAIGLATEFLNYNDNLHVHCNLMRFYKMSVIKCVSLVTMT